MKLVRLAPNGKAYGYQIPLNAPWTGAPLKIDALTNLGVIVQSTGNSAGTVTVNFEVRSGDGTIENPYSAWNSLTLETPITIAGADINESVWITDVAFDEFRVTITEDPAADGTLGVWVRGRGIH